MEKLLTSKTVSLTEMRDPAKVLANAGDAPVAVLNRNKVVAYFVPNTAVNQTEFEMADHEELKKLLQKTIKKDQPVLDYLKDK
jgi:antitoxin StbD